ncbi:MAG: leucine-rich repeat domain-containing protein [Wujia sp.]
MEKRKHKHAKWFRHIFAYVLTFAMIVGLMPVTIAKAEAGSDETGLYFAEYDWETKTMSRLSDGWYTETPDKTGFALIFATKGETGATYRSVDMSEITVTYNADANDENPSALTFSQLEEGQMTESQLSEEDYNNWAVKVIGGGEYFPGTTIPLSWYDFNKTGTYKFAYTDTESGTEYACYLYRYNRAWDFYETNVVTDNPLRDYYYQDITDDPGFYLNQADGEISIGKLTYDDAGNVVIDEAGNPVIDESGTLIAARFQWNEDVETIVTEPYSACISYDSVTGKISIKADPTDGSTDYAVRVYFYVKDTYEENGQPVTNYRQESTDVWVHHGEDMSNSIWLGYDEWNGTVSWKLQGSAEESTVLTPHQDIVGQADGVYDVYLTEKPAYPEDFDWGNVTEEENNKYGWRAGAEPVVYIRNGDTTDTYRVDATEGAYTIDDCGDDDITTWHFTYTYKAGDGIDVFWSDYDAFSYDATEQFQLEIESLGSEPAGTISISPMPADDQRFPGGSYGEKCNFPISQIGEVSVTVTPNEGNTLEEVRIGDTTYVNEAMKGQDDDRIAFTPSEDGSFSHTFTEAELKAYRWEEAEKVPDMDENGKQRYASIYVSANFSGQQGGPDGPGNNYNFSFGTMNGNEDKIRAEYKLEDSDVWVEDIGHDLVEGEKLTVRFILEQGYEINDLSIIYAVKESDNTATDEDNRRVPYITEDSMEAIAQALLSENGYTFTFKPEEDSVNTSGETAMRADEAWMRVQFNVNRSFAEQVVLNFLYQEAVMDENWDYVTAEDDTYQYGIYEGEPGKYKDAIDGWEAENFYFNDEQGFCTHAEDRKPNVADENGNRESYQLVSTYGEAAGTVIDSEPDFVTKKTMGGFVTEGKNVLRFDDEYIEALYIDTNFDGQFTEEELVPTTQKGQYEIELAPAEQYNILAKRTRNQRAGIGWTYLHNAQDDIIVEHGKVYVEKIERKGVTILDGLEISEDGKTYTYETMLENDPYLSIRCDSTGAEAWVKLGDVVTLRLIPQYGYQLETAQINGQQLQAGEEVSTYTVEVTGNLHFGSTFVKAEDKIETPAQDVASAAISGGENATDTGNLELVVADDTDYAKDVTTAVDGNVIDTVATLDMSLNNIVSKGEAGQYWSTPVTEFENDIQLDLELSDVTLAEGESLAVVRDHNGTLTELKTEYDANTKTVSFSTNQFSTYTIVKKTVAAPQPPAHVHAGTKVVAVAASCTAAGNSEYYTCTCGKYFSDVACTKEIVKDSWVIAATGHKWDDGTVTKAATATEDGVKTYHCTNAGCTETKTDVIDKTGTVPAKPTIPSKGKTLTDSKSGLKYKVSSTGTKNPTVTYTGVTNKKAKTVSIPTTVKIGGVTYKVTAIASNAFKGNKTITKVTIGSNITQIGSNAFNGCTKLTTITIGKNVTSIGTNAFKGCSALTKITLPAKVTTIAANAFSGCKKLKTITIKSTKMTNKTIAKNAFKGVTKDTTIKVPGSKVDAYEKLFKSKGLSSKVKVKK